MKWPAQNTEARADEIEAAAKTLKQTLNSAAQAASRAERAFNRAANDQRKTAMSAAEDLARAELGLSPQEPMSAKHWLSFDMACAGKLGLIPLASQAKIIRDEAQAFLSKLPKAPSMSEIARAELAAANAKAKASSARLAHAQRNEELLPHTGVTLRPARERGLALPELRQLYESRSGWDKVVDFFARRDIHRGALSFQKALAQGTDPFAVASAESEAKRKAREAQDEHQAAVEAHELLQRNRSIYASREEAARRPSPWLDDAGPVSRVQTLVFEDSRDWSAAFEQLSRTRPHLAPMAASAAGAALGLCALLGASGRCLSEQAGLLKAAGNLDTLQSNMKRLRSKSGSSAKAKLKFDMAEVHQSAESARQRFIEWAGSGPSVLLDRARRFQPGQGEAPAQALLEARAVFGPATPSLAKRDSSSSSSSSSTSSNNSTFLWEALFWQHLLFNSSPDGVSATGAIDATASVSPTLDFSQTSASANWASSDFTADGAVQSSSSCASSSATSCASSASSCSSPSNSCSSCSSGSSCSSCSS